jgi:hypothetical protein
MDMLEIDVLEVSMFILILLLHLTQRDSIRPSAAS